MFAFLMVYFRDGSIAALTAEQFFLLPGAVLVLIVRTKLVSA